jgi:hypothetical protein
MPEKSQKDEETVFDRIDQYSFSSDERFLNGLPSIVAGIAKSKPGATVEKAFYDREMLKAKAFYFSKYVYILPRPMLNVYAIPIIEK